MTPITTSVPYVEHQVFVSTTMSKASTKVNTTSDPQRTQVQERDKIDEYYSPILSLNSRSKYPINFGIKLAVLKKTMLKQPAREIKIVQCIDNKG